MLLKEITSELRTSTRFPFSKIQKWNHAINISRNPCNPRIIISPHFKLDVVARVLCLCDVVSGDRLFGTEATLISLPRRDKVTVLEV